MQPPRVEFSSIEKSTAPKERANIITKLEERGRFELPCVMGMLKELRVFIDRARPADAIFRTNHASNYLPLSGRIPRDRERLLSPPDHP